MSKLDERALALRNALAHLGHEEPSNQRITSCKRRMIDEVVQEIGIAGAATAEVCSELVDLAVIQEVNRITVPISDAVIALVGQFQADCIESVVKAHQASTSMSSRSLS
jgi:hypothetical protein